MNYNIKRVHDKAIIAEIMKNYNNMYPRSLDSIVRNLDTYAEKIREKGIVLIAEKQTLIVGYIVFYMNDEMKKRAYISQIAVEQEYQKQGIGESLIQSCVQYALNRKFKYIMLEVDKKNTSAISFYMKLQFNILEEASDVSWYMLKKL